jgi:hypothetical protein
MLTLDLTAKELEILEHVLADYVSDVGMEIANTDRLEFRDMLKERKALVRRILAAVRDATGANAV